MREPEPAVSGHQAAEVRLAGPADGPALVRLIRSAYRGDSSRRGWTSEADLVDGDRIDLSQVLRVIAGPDSLMLVLAGPDAIVACCQIEDRGGSVAYFGTFAVSPAAQDGGLGRRLLAAAQRQAMLTFGSATMEMTVLAQQRELIGWYERRGFRRTGEVRPFPANDVFARPLRDDLHFVVLATTLAGL